MSWLEDKLADAIDSAVDVTDRIRYGMGPNEKYELVLKRALPGAPSNKDPDAAERYSSTYLGARKWGRIPAEVFNALAIDDFSRPGGPYGEESERIKGVGAQGAEAGAQAGLADEVKRRERLMGLFRGERIGR